MDYFRLDGVLLESSFPDVSRIWKVVEGKQHSTFTLHDRLGQSPRVAFSWLHAGEHTVFAFASWIHSGWEECRESRRCSRDTFLKSYITKYTRFRKSSIPPPSVPPHKAPPSLGLSTRILTRERSLY